MVIRVLDSVPAADTGAQGAIIRDMIASAMRSGSTASVSFAGINTATSSFVNVCFVDLLAHYTLDDIKRKVKIINSTSQINDMIKGRLIQAASLEAA
ncbi:STAS-like domain-containing protein [Methylorubrum subtropicum]|uniref:STAS-like domain-containing protein n=1 Tax=Methylorubrum subtropicum TaxID=3138812 RepID=UPI00399C7222